MAGGANAAAMMCQECGGKAPRTAEGVESDRYECEACGHRFIVDWRKGEPAEPCWPESPEALAEAQRLFALLQAQRRERQ
jgi:DNA-directed RNA polymerase subunit RPC12/RpoP